MRFQNDHDGCSATVFGPRVHSWQCTRRAAVTRNGKKYCRQHDPVAVAAKRQAQEDARKAEERREEDLLRAAERRCKALGYGEPNWQHSYRGPSGWTGGVVLTPDQADALIAKLEAVREQR